MLKSYFKTAWRNLRRNRLFSFINILGLAIGIATCFIIMLYVQSELSYDRFHKNAGDIARIIFQAEINGGKINESVVMAPVAATMKKDFPEVMEATRIVDNGKPKIRLGNKIFRDDRAAFVDSNFFSFFTFPFIEGDTKRALTTPNSVVLTKSTALKFFDKEQAIGQTIRFNNDSTVYSVTAVMEDIPAHSHFHFDIFLSMMNLRDANSDSWMSGGFHTYLLLKPGTNQQKIQARFPDMVARYMGPQIQKGMGLSLEQFRSKGNKLGFVLQPLTAIHLHSDTSNEFEPGGNATYVYIFGGVAFFMLMVACINFINLSTAGASKRAKEVGIRKVAGSGKLQLIRQFLSESLLITFFALLMAFVLLQLALPWFNDISGKQLSIGLNPVLAFIVLGLIVGLAAGIYPAFYLSSFKPVVVLKGKPAGNNKNFALRSGLVVFQFFISVTLIIGTIVVYQQMKYIQNKDLGYNKNQVITIPNSWALGANQKVFKQQMLQDPRVLSATMSWYKPTEPNNYNNALAYPAGNDNLIVSGVNYYVDDQYIPTLGMQMISGRNFSQDFPTDSGAIILNETATKALGWTAETAIDKTVIRQNSPKGDNFSFHVIGVVKNFNFKSLHEAISPLYMTLQPEGGLIFKVTNSDIPGLLADMKTRWDSYNTEEPFTFSFMDDYFNKAYATEQKTGTILNIFAVLTIFVACLGLFGLATFTAEQHTKEIGIRKVLGASVTQVTQMLSKEFLKLVLIASLIAFPVAWWGMNKWLQSFAYRIDISWWVFAIAGLAALAIALLTVSFQAIKAAVANPVKALRSE
ncbi:ABC transporter permease [Agriterribacter sp.]|uniref:ABC transporter permease n=1 Tax=Agriterribacter sp. TaxID=2821509 RepID=UPI002B7B7308|nr:ABC transporter permease [Agriterribacter sp.]HRP54864.1 ABC transporter permease [Agriterribacter sp.]